MSNIIGKVGRRSSRVRLLNICIHIILILGAVTMIYPFLIMLSGSIKSGVDSKYYDIIPRYFYDDLSFFHKYISTKYNEQTLRAVYSLKEPSTSIEKLTAPLNLSETEFKDMEEYVNTFNDRKDINSNYFYVGMISESGVYPYMFREFRAWLQNKYGASKDGLYKLNEECGSDFQEWDDVRISPENLLPRKASTGDVGLWANYQDFKRTSSNELTRVYCSVDGYFLEILIRDVAKSIDKINSKLGLHYKSWSEIVVPSKYPAENKEFAKVWENFVRHEVNLQYLEISPESLPMYRDFLKERYKNDIKPLNTVYGTNYKSFSDIPLLEKANIKGVRRVDWDEFISSKVPVNMITIKSFDHYYREFLKNKYKDIAKLNAEHANAFKSFADVPLYDSSPDLNIAMKEDWHHFAAQLNENELYLHRASIFEYRDYIVDKYRDEKDHARILYDTLSMDYGKAVKRIEDIPVFNSYPAKASVKAQKHYSEAVKSERFIKMLVLKNVEKLKPEWTRFLSDKYKNINALNQNYGMVYTSFETVPVPLKNWEWNLMKKNHSMLFSEFLKRNYMMVLDTLLFNGYAAVNTVIYVILAILGALIVNPLAAYALSRYNPPSTYKILLLLMLTMAFPPMVLGIPNFLMIKELGLLNTFAALILPGLASGYSVFLLKGFFDSLPKELFECATLDGASEWTMFWQIAMTLSKPILAVIALSAFMAAYSNFMMAFLVCQNPKMWTIMVYLYQLQMRSSQAVRFASLVIAAVPTFLVFILCQNIIMKGIVVPTEK